MAARRVGQCLPDDQEGTDRSRVIDLKHLVPETYCYGTVIVSPVLSNALERPSNKHKCVLSNWGLSNALMETETGICTSAKSDFCPILSTTDDRVNVAKFHCIRNFMPMLKML